MLNDKEHEDHFHELTDEDKEQKETKRPPHLIYINLRIYLYFFQKRGDRPTLCY
jgi:hypothetical protein